jgi:HEXXH motif-containing protein
LLLLRAVLRFARARPDSVGPLSSVDSAWHLLLRAEGAAPDVVADMLTDPQMCTWLAHTLRRLRDVSRDRAPLWFHVGQLHAFAVAAAVRAGLRADLIVPVWAGDLLLPSLARLRLPIEVEWGHAEVTIDTTVRIRCAGTTVELDPRSAGWLPSRSLRSRAGDLDLVLRLDDLALYRGLDNPIRPAPLDEAELARWQGLLDNAWRLLVHGHPHRARELAAGMTTLVPLPPTFRFRPHSTSVEDGFGSAILSEPHDAAQLAVTLVHEFQHSVLNGLRHLVTLAHDDDPFLGYAPWRDDPRPVGALIHGVFAFTAVAEFWAAHRTRLHGSDADLADFEFALWRHQTETVLRSAQGHRALTRLGSRFLDGVAERLARLHDEPVPPRIAASAEAAAADHVAGWRACHLQPDQTLVRAAADAWVAGRPTPPQPRWAEPVVEPGRAAQRLDTKAVLMRIRITDPELFDRLRAEPHLVEGASSADVAYVAGDLAEAHRRYLIELSATPDRAAAWSGLGLTRAGLGRDAELLLRQPELVRAVTEQVTADTGRQPSPDKLAVWLAGGER